MDIRTKRFIGAFLFITLIGCVPLFVKNGYHLGILTMVAINTILVIGLNLLMGYAGQVSLGHAAFYGIGAYSTAVFTSSQFGWHPFVAALAGIVISIIVAAIIGIPCLRLRGHYLALATLGFGWIMYIVMKNWEPLGGTSGIEKIPFLVVGNIVINDDQSRFYFTWAVAMIILWITWNIVHSRVGRALRALHTSESAASSLGVYITGYKLQVFLLSAVFASIAGSLYAHCINFVSPNTFNFVTSVQIVVMTVIGGMASVWGAPVGAGAITILVEVLREVGDKVKIMKDSDVIMHGLILVLAMIFMPSGVYCTIFDGIVRLFRRKKTGGAA
ncbi:MAG: branched-chain amino acid ABC transporter permease [bacterium]